MVRFENVGMRYGLGPEVLRDINFHLRPGSFHFLTGPTGAGKSSLLKLLALSHRPSRGLVTLFNKEVSTLSREDLPGMRRKIGVVYQDFRLLDHLSTLENVALPLKIAGAKNDQVYQHVAELLEWVGLGRQVDAKPPTLSGGEKQRVAIARAVINRPQLLIADEPTGSMDAEMGLRLMYLFQELNKIGTTVVVATHDLELIKRFGNPVMILKDGMLTTRAQDELPSQFSKDPA
ncbi:cell division ATP-binding protein FtsE [Sneathiella sp. HT1-7]|uniref:cell division ATP-binding protein FtsE n=1 Tax=Sneathiella sp. HT1-7 TaxID=2887192 RepID=UPI001D154E80|nr:cell division ATP-binding protein FtsE [Sneathiella sp. HT1-7]MCC3304129.1 cell division ATP-binding protein FtsE [Sneathiella sp. HT1-7]